jgi:FAD/FMN-containing dehydrogenase
MRRSGVTLWSNWAGNVVAEPRGVEVAADEHEICAIIRDARGCRGSLRVGGAGHSFGPICATGETLVTLVPTLRIDIAPGIARVWPGTRISALGEPLWNAGVGLANQGDIDVQHIGGAGVFLSPSLNPLFN